MRLLGVREFVYNNPFLYWRTPIGMNGNVEIYQTEVLHVDKEHVSHNATEIPSTWQPSCIKPSS